MSKNILSFFPLIDNCRQNIKAVFDTAIKAVLQPQRHKEVARKEIRTRSSRSVRQGSSLCYFLKPITGRFEQISRHLDFRSRPRFILQAVLLRECLLSIVENNIVASFLDMMLRWRAVVLEMGQTVMVEASHCQQLDGTPSSLVHCGVDCGAP